MMGGVPWLVVLPGALAAVPAVLPAGSGARRLALIGLGTATLTLALAVYAVWPGLPGWVGAGWRDDPLGRTLSVFPPLAWFLMALRLATGGDRIRAGGSRKTGWWVAAQLGTACAMAVCRVERLSVLPVLFAVLLAAIARLDGRDWRNAAAGLAPVLAMAAGIMVLSAQLGVPARWVALDGAGGPVGPPLPVAGLALLVAPVLVLALAAVLRPVLVAREGVGPGLARLLVAVPASAVALRAGASVGAIAVAAGVVGIVLSLALLPRGPGPRDVGQGDPGCSGPEPRGLDSRVWLAASIQFGACLVGIGVGGAGGVAAAVMLLGSLSALLPLALPGAEDGTPGWLRKVAIAALVGLPPFGSFAGGMVLLLRLFAVSSWLALLVLVGFAVAALVLLDAVRRAPASEGERGAGLWMAVGGSVLAVSLWFGLAMPGVVSDWLLALWQSRP